MPDLPEFVLVLAIGDELAFCLESRLPSANYGLIRPEAGPRRSDLFSGPFGAARVPGSGGVSMLRKAFASAFEWLMLFLSLGIIFGSGVLVGIGCPWLPVLIGLVVLLFVFAALGERLKTLFSSPVDPAIFVDAHSRRDALTGKEDR
jgi:hypothetical protein